MAARPLGAGNRGEPLMRARRGTAGGRTTSRLPICKKIEDGCVKFAPRLRGGSGPSHLSVRCAHDSWSGVGHVAVRPRLARSVLTQPAWRHSPPSATGTAWERTPWRATQRRRGRRSSAQGRIGDCATRSARTHRMPLIVPDVEAPNVKLGRYVACQSAPLHHHLRSGRHHAAGVTGFPIAGTPRDSGKAVRRAGALPKSCGG